MALEMHPSIYVHPGPWLKHEIVEPYGMTVTQVAEHLGVSRQNMSLLLNGHASLTAMMALRFRATLHDFIGQLHIYPTMAEALKIIAISRFKDPSKLSCCAE